MKKKLIVIETAQFFEIEVPADTDEKVYVESDECRNICADKIACGMTDLTVERVLTRYDPTSEQWT